MRKFRFKALSIDNKATMTFSCASNKERGQAVNAIQELGNNAYPVTFEGVTYHLDNSLENITPEQATQIVAKWNIQRHKAQDEIKQAFNRNVKVFLDSLTEDITENIRKMGRWTIAIAYDKETNLSLIHI